MDIVRKWSNSLVIRWNLPIKIHNEYFTIRSGRYRWPHSIFECWTSRFRSRSNTQTHCTRSRFGHWPCSNDIRSNVSTNVGFERIWESNNQSIDWFSFCRDTGAISDQLNSINMYGFAGMIVGGVMGGLKYAQMANITFRERNEITVFDSQLAGKRKLQDATTLGFAKGAYRIGWRMGVFCWCFSYVHHSNECTSKHANVSFNFNFNCSGVSIAMNEYYNKPAISSYSVAGLVTGALYKFPLGPKGMISGGFFGTFIGTAAGALLVGALKLSGVSMKEIHRKQSEYFDLRDKSVWQIVPTQVCFVHGVIQ